MPDVRVPPGYDGSRPAPLVVAFTGLGLSPDSFDSMTRFTARAEERGFVLAIPAPAGATWDASDGSPDIVATNALIADVLAAYCVDEARVYAAGFADGGSMAQAFACAAPERIAAIGVVASTFLACRADVPMIAFHGLTDALVPFDGGTSAEGTDAAAGYPSVRRSVTEWARALGCDALPTISRPATEVELSTFKRCRRGDGDALLYTVIDGGHTWPGGADIQSDRLGATTHQIEATALIWDFFSSRALR
jgi:polyhydroxybutyrate depolymerase